MADNTRKQFDVVVVGAGPAGLAAAASAAEAGARVGLLDDNPAVGGQIWRGEASQKNSPAAAWAGRLQAAGAEVLCGAQVVYHNLNSRTLFAETRTHFYAIGFSNLVLATGARERLLPFPGWTLPNIMAAGGLQAMVKSGLPVSGKRVVVAGTGPLLLAVAAYLRKHGAHVLAICEQATRNALAGFALALLHQPGKLRQAFTFQRELRGIPLWPNSWPVRAGGKQSLESVVLSRNGEMRELACHYLACSFHLVPNTELAAALGCRLENDCVQVDDQQQTSIPGVFCAGEPTGIGGLELSVIEGQIAGMAAAGYAANQTSNLRKKRHKAQAFAYKLETTFKLRPDLKKLPDDSTLVCRCEDVTLARAARHHSWRDAKNQTRCGMGPCQGRVCGPITQFLFDWHPESVRPPIFPARLQNLAAMAGTSVSDDSQSTASKATGGYQ